MKVCSLQPFLAGTAREVLLTFKDLTPVVTMGLCPDQARACLEVLPNSVGCAAERAFIAGVLRLHDWGVELPPLQYSQARVLGCMLPGKRRNTACSGFAGPPPRLLRHMSQQDPLGPTGEGDSSCVQAVSARVNTAVVHLELQRAVVRVL